VAALRHGHGRGGHGSRGHLLPRVVYVARYKKSAAENPRGAGGGTYNRILRDPHRLAAAFARRGVAMETCCDQFFADRRASKPSPKGKSGGSSSSSSGGGGGGGGRSSTSGSTELSANANNNTTAATDPKPKPNSNPNPVAAMAAALSTADVVVSLHGAGLVNALFARRGVIVVGHPSPRPQTNKHI
jgi:hypothetical protein